MEASGEEIIGEGRAVKQVLDYTTVSLAARGLATSVSAESRGLKITSKAMDGRVQPSCQWLED
jgi:hypothetical protein